MDYIIYEVNNIILITFFTAELSYKLVLQNLLQYFLQSKITDWSNQIITHIDVQASVSLSPIPEIAGGMFTAMSGTHAVCSYYNIVTIVFYNFIIYTISLLNWFSIWS